MMEQLSVLGKKKDGIYKQAFTSGNFFVVLLIEDGAELDLELGRNLVAKIEEIVEQTPEMTPSQLVELASTHITESNLQLNILVGTILQQKLSLAVSGKMSARLVRKGKIISLIRSGQPSQITGAVFHDDVLIFGSDAFFEFSGDAQLSSPDDLENFRDQVSANLESSEGSEPAVGQIVAVSLVEEAEAESESGEAQNIVDPEVKVGPMISTPLSTSGGLSILEKISDMTGLFKKAGLRIRREGNDEENRLIFRKRFFLICGAAIILVCFIAFQLRSKVTEAQAKVISQMDVKTSQAIASADKLVGLNDQIARETLLMAKAELDSQVKESFGDNWEKGDSSTVSQIKKIYQNLNDHLFAASRIFNVDSLSTFSDFSLLKSSPKVVNASLVAGKIVALDQNNGAVYSISSGSKTAAIVGGTNEFKNGQFVDSTETKAYVFSQGIFQIGLDGQGSAKQVVQNNANWGTIAGLKAFAGNVYLLDKTNNQIWKYPGTDFGFASSSAYLQSGLSVDFSNVDDLAIDGFVYVLSKTGNIARFSGGGVTDFKITGLPDSLSDPSSIFVTDETKNLYLYDSGNSRVVVLDKNGLYLSQYRFSKPNELVVKVLADETAKKIFLVTPTKILAMDMR